VECSRAPWMLNETDDPGRRRSTKQAWPMRYIIDVIDPSIRLGGLPTKLVTNMLVTCGVLRGRSWKPDAEHRRPSIVAAM
jgi:hypothetical protein